MIADWNVLGNEVERDLAHEWNLVRPAGDDVLHLWPVSRAVNRVRNNGAELLDRVDDPHAPPPSNAQAGENSA